MDNTMNSNSLLWFFAILFLVGGNGFMGNRNPAPMGPPPATQESVNDAINNQSIQNQLNNLGIATANNNYETAKTVFDQNLMLQNQNNTNLTNMIQGFNSIVLQMQNQNAQLAQQIANLGFKMETCCCEIKTQMLQQRLDDALADKVQLQNQVSNYNQTQTILGQLGRFVAWAGSGAQTLSSATSG